MARFLRRSKRSWLVALAIVVTALAAAAVGSAFTSRATGPFLFLGFNGSMNGAGSKALYSEGNFTIFGKCISMGGGVFRSQLVIKTAQDHAQLRTAAGDSDLDFNVSDGERKLTGDAVSATGSQGSPDLQANSDLQFVGIRSNGRLLLQGYGWTAAGHGANCSWGAMLTRHQPLS
jgi:hypothetical protein